MPNKIYKNLAFSFNMRDKSKFLNGKNTVIFGLNFTKPNYFFFLSSAFAFC